MNKILKIVVLISGNGSNLQAMIDATNTGLSVEVLAVISNKADAYGLERAKKASIPTHIISHTDYPDRESFDTDLREQIEAYQPDLIVLAGFMRRLGSTFINHFEGRIINIHPSLLPKYRGLDTHQRALDAGDKTHGISIHFVNDDLDGGPIICQSSLNVTPSDTVDSLKNRIQAIEHQLYPVVLDWFSHNRVVLHDNQVSLDGKLLEPTGQQITLS